MGRLKVPRWIKSHYHMLLAVGSVGLIGVILVSNQLTSLFPYPNSLEAPAIQNLNTTLSLSSLVDLPYYTIARFLDLFLTPLAALRITSATVGLATAVLLGFTIHRWFSDRVAVAGSLFIITSSWFLAFSRIGFPYVMAAFWLSLFLALGTWRTYTMKPMLTDFLIAVAAGLSLYSPRFIWLGLAGCMVLAFRRRKQFFFVPRKHQWFLPLVSAFFVIPIIYAGVKNIEYIKPLLGFGELPSSYGEFVSRVLQNTSQIFIRGTESPEITLGRLPLLDIFSIVMVGLGFYYFEKNLRLRRTQILVAIGTLSMFLVALAPFEVGNLAIFFPIVMVFAVGGIVELLERWLKGFPRNPIARTAGVCMVVAAIGFTSFYHLQRYFVAWANNPNVINAHTASSADKEANR